MLILHFFGGETEMFLGQRAFSTTADALALCFAGPPATTATASCSIRMVPTSVFRDCLYVILVLVMK